MELAAISERNKMKIELKEDRESKQPTLADVVPGEAFKHDGVVYFKTGKQAARSYLWLCANILDGATKYFNIADEVTPVNAKLVEI